MKQLHAARHAVEAHLIRGFLISHGISAEVRGEFLTSGWGELPVDVCSVWVTDDAQYAAATSAVVLERFTIGHQSSGCDAATVAELAFVDQFALALPASSRRCDLLLPSGHSASTQPDSSQPGKNHGVV